MTTKQENKITIELEFNDTAYKVERWSDKTIPLEVLFEDCSRLLKEQVYEDHLTTTT